MEGEINMLELLQSTLELDSSSSDNDHLKKMLEACVEHGSFHLKAGSDMVVKTINSSLNYSFNKDKGLVLLLAYLPQISSEAYSSNAVSWMVLCNKLLSQKGGVADSLSLRALAALIKLSVKFPDVCKEAGKHIVPKFLLDHVRRKTKFLVHEDFLNCVEACITNYSGPAGEFKADVVGLATRVADGGTRARGAELAAARCYAATPRLGGGGRHGAGHRTAWRQAQLSLIASLHSLLDALYEHADGPTDLPQEASDARPLSLDRVDDADAVCRAQKLAGQFSTISLYLQTMLIEEFPVPKSVAAEAILDVVSRAALVCARSTPGPSREQLALASVLPDVLTAALRLLQSLILCLGRNLLPYGALISQHCTQVIVWTSRQHHDWPYTLDKPYSTTRGAAYSCLVSWLGAAGGAAPLSQFPEKALPVVLSDIRPGRPAVRLRVGVKSKKGKKKQDMSASTEEGAEKKEAVAANKHLCSLGLRLLTALVESSNPTFNSDDYKKITAEAVALAAPGGRDVPYRDAGCLAALQRLLLALCLRPCAGAAPPIAPAAAAFAAAAHHPSPQVRDTCILALSALEKILRPTCATLYFPLSSDDKDLPFRNQEDSGENQDKCQSDVEDVPEDEVPAKKPKLGNQGDETMQIIYAEEESIVEVRNGNEEIYSGDDDSSVELVEEFVDLSEETDSSSDGNMKPPVETITVEVEHETDSSSDGNMKLPVETITVEVEHSVDEREGTGISTNLSADPESAKSECELPDKSINKMDVDSSGQNNISNDINEPQPLFSDEKPTVNNEETVRDESQKNVGTDENEDDAEVSNMLLDFKDVS